MTNEFEETVQKLDHDLQPDKSFDVIKRELFMANRRAYLYFIDGFIKDEVFEKMLEFLLKQTPETLNDIQDMERFSKDKMPYVEVDYTYDIQMAETSVLSGPALLIIDGIHGMLLVDTRTYPVRSIEEPQKDKSLRGSRDGFVETLIFNTAMIRRRIRTNQLRMEFMQVGKRSKVDVAISYIEGLADDRVVKTLHDRLKAIDLNGISMTQQALAEVLVPSHFINPFPRIKFTERPDYASACILDGRVVLIMDNTPCVLVVPTTYNDFFRDVDDYYFTPMVATYNRIIRMVVSFLTVFITPVYLLFYNNPQIRPEWLKAVIPSDSGHISLFVQLLVLELVVDGLELASLNTPDLLSNSMGIIGGLLLSEFAVNAGWFIGEAIILVAFVTIAGFTQPSFEMGYAKKFERLLLLIAVEIFGLWGLIGGTALVILALLLTNTLTGKNYLYPLIPFNGRKLFKEFVRPSLKKDDSN